MESATATYSNQKKTSLVVTRNRHFLMLCKNKVRKIKHRILDIEEMIDECEDMLDKNKTDTISTLLDLIQNSINLLLP